MDEKLLHQRITWNNQSALVCPHAIHEPMMHFPDDLKTCPACGEELYSYGAPKFIQKSVQKILEIKD